MGTSPDHFLGFRSIPEPRGVVANVNDQAQTGRCGLFEVKNCATVSQYLPTKGQQPAGLVAVVPPWRFPLGNLRPRDLLPLATRGQFLGCCCLSEPSCMLEPEGVRRTTELRTPPKGKRSRTL